MAIACHHADVVSRSKGKCIVAAAAYRAGEKLYDERTGLTFDYSHKSGVVYAEILAPDDAPLWAKTRQELWNKVEQFEKRKDAQTARQIEIALPKELTQEQNIAVARAYTQTFVDQGMIADLCIHDKGDGNPHAHILLTMRTLEGESFGLKKAREWNKTDLLRQWREDYQTTVNDYLEQAGRPERIDARSYEKQGIDKIPTKHLGHYAHQLEQQGISSVLGNLNREITAENQRREVLKSQLAQLEEARRSELARLEEAQREAAKRHQRKYVRPSKEEPSRHVAPPKSLDERLAEKTQEYRERKRRKHSHHDERGHDHTRDH